MTGQALANQASRNVVSILFGILVLSATTVGVPAAGAAPSDPTTTHSAPTKAAVSYELTGSGVAGYVTYQTDNNQLHATGVPLPWSVQVTRAGHNPSTSVTDLLSAQGVGPGSITCTIKVDGKVVSQNTATGDPARVVCEHHGGTQTSTSTTTAQAGPHA